MSGQRPRWAALDVGTNSVLLSVAESAEDAGFSLLSERATVTRLGQGVDKTGRLHPDAEARTLACLQSYREEMDRWGVTRARGVGTSALRDAEGSQNFLARARDVLGFELEVVSGDVEARLTFDGALIGLPLNGPTFVFDIGGGSTEFVLGNAESGEIIEAKSINVGSVRLTERSRLSDPPTGTELQALRAMIRSALREVPLPSPRVAQAVGVAGTVTSLVAIYEDLECYDPEFVHGYELTSTVLEGLVEQLASLTLEERRKLPGLSPGRADVIIAGALLCQEILQLIEASSMIVSDHGVRFGLLKALAEERK
jgi:exopolyphosphatase/guanosine-5'-triphosphate,3'-diphosphate pyrophosphatase